MVFEGSNLESVHKLYKTICIVIEFSSSFIFTISFKYKYVSNWIGKVWFPSFRQTLLASFSSEQFFRLQKASCISRWIEKRNIRTTFIWKSPKICYASLIQKVQNKLIFHTTFTVFQNMNRMVQLCCTLYHYYAIYLSTLIAMCKLQCVKWI